MRTSEFKRRFPIATAVEAARAPETEVFVPFSGLAAHGINYTRVHTRRMIARGLFPPPVMLSPNRIAWRLSDLAAWKASRPTAPARASE